MLVEYRQAGRDLPRVEEVWCHANDWSDCVSADGVRRTIFDQDRAVVVCGVERSGVYAAVWKWDKGAPIRGDIALVLDTFTVCESFEAKLDENGELLALLRAVETTDVAVGNEGDRLEIGIKRAARLVPHEVVFPSRPAEPQIAIANTVALDQRLMRGIPPAARTDRRALSAFLRNTRLGSRASELADEVAENGYRLQPTDVRVNSRLGGSGVLPAGEPWPRGPGGCPLSFLARIDLAEIADPAPLPSEGSILFFAAIGAEDPDALVDHSPNAPSSAARVYYVRSQTDLVDASEPESLALLRHRRVVGQAQLTLPDDYAVSERLELTPTESAAYEELATQLRFGTGRRAVDGGDHWVLGLWTNVHGEPVEPDTVLLLQLAPDSQLGFHYLDLGMIQFRIGRAALAAGDWSEVTAAASSA